MIEVNVVNKLISPEDNSDMNLTKDLPPKNFEWEEAEASQGITPNYEIIFFKENGIPSQPIIKTR